ncbi:mannosyltransferase [Testicularia cyperi]|uniref:GPI mannosyltransferase 2 n=1 Tax=Testicularia cyperi TaxID=1882483 RepID=A0A317XNF5_9BASI|nr:mannosyltransferase [Testicularia cyperi]
MSELRSRATQKPVEAPSQPDAIAQGSATSKASRHNPLKELRRARSQILRLSILVRLLSVSALIVTSYTQQAFDTSHELLSYTLDSKAQHGLSVGLFRPLLAFVRWDTIYFLSAASPSSGQEPDLPHAGGYHLEQTLAFQPGIVLLLRAAGFVTPSMDGSWSPTSAILATALLANLATLIAPLLLFDLTLKLTGKHRDCRFAYITALLSVLAPTAGTTLSSPTPEPFFSIFALLGMLALERSSSFLGMQVASLWFALSTAFRANGILLLGLVGFKLLFGPNLRPRSMLQRIRYGALPMAISTVLIMAPFVLFQVWAYGRFCSSSGEADSETLPRPWCSSTIPSVYSFVQSHYWNVGLFRYWHLAQLPNFVLAAPVIVLACYGVFGYISRPRASSTARQASTSFSVTETPAFVPYIMLGTAVVSLLVFASHVQIALRFASPGGFPLVWWGAAWVVLDKDDAKRHTTISYLCIQMLVSIVLYAGFYPPA